MLRRDEGEEAAREKEKREAHERVYGCCEGGLESCGSDKWRRNELWKMEYGNPHCGYP